MNVRQWRDDLEREAFSTSLQGRVVLALRRFKERLAQSVLPWAIGFYALGLLTGGLVVWAVMR